jgi:hypothetical protein
VNPAIFFEGLIMSVKNETLSKQSTIYKIKNHRKKILRDRINFLLKNLTLNSAEIFNYENILDNLIETDLKIELEKYSIFERVNNEKITPHFMNTVRGICSKNSDLDKICDDDGSVFETEIDREKHMTDTFRNIYKKPRVAGAAPGAGRYRHRRRCRYRYRYLEMHR